jgi:glycosyltransferase involved in cell wall biosynthesis
MLSDYGYIAGGAELMMHNLSESLKQQGHQVLVFASKAGLAKEQDKPVVADKWCYGTTSPLRALVQTANPMAARQLRKVLGEFKPDVIHAHMFLTQLSPLILRELRQRAIIYTAHWYRSVCMTGFKMLPDGKSCRQPAGTACLKERCVPFRDWLPLTMQMNILKRNRKTITAVVASSGTIRSRLEQDGFLTDKTILYGTRELTENPGLKSPPRIGFAARLVREKGGAVLIDALQRIAREIPTVVLDVFGNGPELAALKKQAIELGVNNNVCFQGYLEQDELQKRLAAAWVQVAPTLFEEPGGMVGYEAAMRGTALVASHYGGLVDTVIPGENGYLVPPGDADRLAGALLKVLSDKQRAEEFGKASRLLAKRRFTLERVTEQYLGLYHELVDAQAPEPKATGIHK